MRYATSTANGMTEFIAVDEFKAVPITMAVTAKAGAPVKADGTLDTTGSAALGVLVYDVDIDKNPNGALMVEGIIDLTKAKAHSGVSTMTAAGLKTGVPGIVCRDNIGVNE